MTGCPSREQLVKLRVRTNQGDDDSEIRAHIRSCAKCGEVLEALRQEETSANGAGHPDDGATVAQTLPGSFDGRTARVPILRQTVGESFGPGRRMFRLARGHHVGGFTPNGRPHRRRVFARGNRSRSFSNSGSLEETEVGDPARRSPSRPSRSADSEATCSRRSPRGRTQRPTIPERDGRARARPCLILRRAEVEERRRAGRLRDPRGARPRGHGDRLQGPPSPFEPARRLEDDPRARMPTRSRSLASRSRRKRSPRSATPIFCRSTTSENSTARRMSHSSCSKGGACSIGCGGRRCRPSRRPSGWSRWSWRWTRPTGPASCIATSSRPTSSSAPTASPRSPTSAWPSGWRRTRGRRTPAR